MERAVGGPPEKCMLEVHPAPQGDVPFADCGTTGSGVVRPYHTGLAVRFPRLWRRVCT